MPSDKKMNDIEQLLAAAADMQPLNHSDRLAKLVRETSSAAGNTEALSDDELGYVAGGVKQQERDDEPKR